MRGLELLHVGFSDQLALGWIEGERCWLAGIGPTPSVRETARVLGDLITALNGVTLGEPPVDTSCDGEAVHPVKRRP